MRRLNVFNLMTLDGSIAGKDGDISWHRVDDEFQEPAQKASEKLDLRLVRTRGFGNGNVLLAYEPARNGAPS